MENEFNLSDENEDLELQKRIAARKERKNEKHVENEEKNKILNFVLKVPVFSIIFLIIAKYFVYKATGSLSIFSSFTDSFLDLISSAITFIALRFAMKEKTMKYQHGYYAMVDIATVLVATFILSTTCLIYYRAAINIFQKNLIEYSYLSTLVMIFSISFSLLISIFLKVMYKKTNSVLVYNEIAHFFSDIYTNGGILISLIITKFYTNYLVDPIIAIIMGTLSARPAIEILISAINNIMAKEVDFEIKDRIISLTKKYPEITGYHGFKTRKSGEKIFSQIHIELPRKLSFELAHEIIEELEEDIKREIDNIDVLIHADPR